MSIVYEHVSEDGNERFHVDLGDNRHLLVNVTGEGVIMDVFLRGFTSETDTHLGTVGMTFDEWADDIVANDVVTMIGHT